MTLSQDYFNQMIIDIDTKLFDINFQLTRFVIDLLEILPDKTANFTIMVPFALNDLCKIIQINGIKYDIEKGGLFVIGNEDDMLIPWDDFDIGAQYFLGNFLFNTISSDSIYYNLSNEEPLSQ